VKKDGGLTNGRDAATTTTTTTGNKSCPPPALVHFSINRRIEMPPEAMFPENVAPPSDLVHGSASASSAGQSEQEDANNNNNHNRRHHDVTDLRRRQFPEEFFVDEEGNLKVQCKRIGASHGKRKENRFQTRRPKL
jgi:hypothetical protein